MVFGDPPLTNCPPVPEWLVAALALLRMLELHEQDKFEGVMRQTAYDAVTGAPIVAGAEGGSVEVMYQWIPRIRCCDCPGKLYTPGPGKTADNFLMHLGNRGHRERVDGRVKKAAAEATTGDSMASDGGLYALVGLEGPVEMWPQMPTLLSTLSGDRPGETSHANQTPPTTQGLMQGNKESIGKPVVQASAYWSDTERVSFISMLSVLGTNWPMISEMLETKTTVMVIDFYNHQIKSGRIDYKTIAEAADKRRIMAGEPTL